MADSIENTRERSAFRMDRIKETCPLPQQPWPSIAMGIACKYADSTCSTQSTTVATPPLLWLTNQSYPATNIDRRHHRCRHGNVTLAYTHDNSAD